MATARPGEKALKMLFALSGNRCAFPGCPVQLVQGSALIGKVCHIKAAHAGGPRYDAKQSPPHGTATETSFSFVEITTHSSMTMRRLTPLNDFRR